MSKIYEEEEKRMYLDAFNVSGKTKTAFARDNNIPEATFRAWIIVLGMKKSNLLTCYRYQLSTCTNIHNFANLYICIYRINALEFLKDLTLYQIHSDVLICHFFDSFLQHTSSV